MSTEQKEHLKELLALPSLETLQKRLDNIKLFGPNTFAGRTYTETDVQHQIDQWKLRDSIQETRPVDCWCLGRGGQGREWHRSGETVAAKHCGCPDGVALKDTERQAINQAYASVHERWIRLTWDAAQIPQRFQSMRLDTSPLPADIVKQFRQPDLGADASEQELDIWSALNVLWEGSWFLHGGYGTGKTGLAVGLAHERMTESECGGILFTTVPAMLSELRSTYGRSEEGKPTEHEVLKKYIEASLLILDDIGAEQVKDSGWVEDRLYQVIGTRHDEMRSTIFTSNLGLDLLAQRIGERTVWRIAEMCGSANVVEIKGKNLRDGS